MKRSKILSVTIKDVASHAGVSVATVSHVINRSRFVTEETQKKVMQAIKELNYYPNILAKNLRSKRSNAVGVVICDLENPFFIDVLRGIETSLGEKNYDMLVTNTNYNIPKEKKAVEMFYGKQVDGVIIVPGSNKGEHVEFLVDLGIPVVILDKEIEIKKKEVDFVLTDNRKGSKEMIKHLVGLGHRNIAIIAGPQDTSTGKERLIGYLEAFEEFSIPIKEEYIKIGDFKKPSGEKLTLELLSLNPRPSVIFACNNPMGIGSLEILKKERINIPADIGLVLFDDLPWFPYIDPPLTSVSQTPFVMGKVGADLLLERLTRKRKKQKKVILEAEIKIRFSGGEKGYKEIVLN